MTGPSRGPSAVAGSADGPPPDVVLVSMPYASLARPSLGLGLLKAILARDGITATVAHAGLWFADSVGLPRYELCSSRSPSVFLAGEWTFAAAAFGDDPRREERDAEFLRQISEASEGHPNIWRSLSGEALVAELRALREAATRFTDEAARRVLATGARVVGCTSTFEQHVASLALLRRIRELDPEVITMLGGANCETVMGETTHRCFGWVDYVVSGEADGLITELCRHALARGRAPGKLPRGVIGPGRHGGGPGPSISPRAVFHDLDSLPAPRFDDYFAELAASPLRSRVRPGIPVETSRGCWWGAVHQCTFCGLNGTGLTYRAKSPERVLAELDELQDRHGIGDFEAVDNILDMRYHKTLLPMLARGRRGRRIFYEIKANVSRAQVRAMVAAGITWVQPGIESLHSEVLALMDKGIQGWQNVQLLKWSAELGLRLSWSLLWGFPGEKDDWYQDMAGWLPALEHLQPPATTPRVRFDRYSVYHEQAQRLGLILFPIGAMSLVYPVPDADLHGLSYFFATEPGVGPLRYLRDLAAQQERGPGIGALVGAARAWRAAHATGHATGRRPVLRAQDDGRELTVTDSRGCARAPRQVLTGLDRAVLLACDAAPRRAKLAEVLAAPPDQVADAVARLAADHLVLEIDGRLVGLALVGLPPGGPVPRYPDHTEFPGGHVFADRPR